MKIIKLHKNIITLHKIVSKILHKGKTVKTRVQKDNIPTQKHNKHTRKKDKDTPKHSTLTQKNAREQGVKLLKENGSEDFRKSCRKSVQARANREEKNSSSAEIPKNSARAKNKNPRGKRGGRRTAQTPRTAKRNKIL